MPTAQRAACSVPHACGTPRGTAPTRRPSARPHEQPYPGRQSRNRRESMPRQLEAQPITRAQSGTDRSSSTRSCKRRPHRRLFGIHSTEWRSSPATADEEAQCASHTIIPKDSQAVLHLPIPHLDIVNPIRVSEVDLGQSHSKLVSPKCQSRVSIMICNISHGWPTCHHGDVSLPAVCVQEPSWKMPEVMPSTARLEAAPACHP